MVLNLKGFISLIATRQCFSNKVTNKKIWCHSSCNLSRVSMNGLSQRSQMYSSHASSDGDGSQIAGMRKPYKGRQDVFDVDNLISKEPFEQFSSWFEEAKNTPGIVEANAMALATSTRDGKPSVRMVLMKGLSKDGIDFYTNYRSRKSQELMENPVCSLMFYWELLNKSVRIEGKVEKLSQEHSEKYFHSRPRSSQIGACVSERQSSAIPSRQILDKRKEDLESEYGDERVPIPKPEYWGGFRLVPDRFEFWQGQTNRIHDRIVFRKQQPGETIDSSVTLEGKEGWVYERLQP